MMRAWLKHGADAVGVGLFTAMFLTFIVQIAARFGFNRPLPWTDELAVILYVWVILWASAFMVPARQHVVFDLLYNAMPARTRRGMLLLGSVLLAGLAASALPASWDYVHFMAREGTPVLGMPFMWVFLPFVLLLAAITATNLWRCWRLLRGEAADDGDEPA
jgi:TRAP-type C4-dicarboxylate transport system permease small subunit